MNISLGWWLIPLAISFVGFAVAFEFSRNESGLFANFFAFLAYLIVFVVPSLMAWLIWALL